MRRILPFSAVLLASFLAGCSTNEAPAEPAPPTPDPATITTPAPATEADPHAGHAHASGEAHNDAASAPVAPFAGGGGMAEASAPLTPTPDLDKKIAEAEKGKDKKATAAAYAARGVSRMNDDKAGAKVKYRAALEDYRKALSLDPENAEAKSNKEMIESIYKSMGRPIPGEEDSAAK
ncbi:MAG: hypothetical protein QM758_26380 [Armatimonas sp.]